MVSLVKVAEFHYRREILSDENRRLYSDRPPWGLMLGSWSIKADLRKARGEIEALKTKLASQDKSASKLSGITSMLKLPDVEAEPPKTRSHHRHRTGAGFDATNATPAPADTPATNPISPTRAQAATNSPSMRDNLEKAVALWKVRVDLAQDSFISNVTTSEDQAVQFAVSMAAMNLRLSNSIRTWVDQVITNTAEPSAEQSIRLLNELSSTLVLAYEDLDRSQPPDWRLKAGSKFEVFDFINPEVALPLTETEHIFGKSRHRDTSEDDDDTATGMTFP